MKKKKSLLIIFLIVFSIVGSIFILLNRKSDQVNIDRILGKFNFKLKASEDNLDQYIRSQMKICFENGGRDDCYANLSYLLMHQFDFKKILESFARNETYPEIFSRCHEETHYLSRLEYQRVRGIAKVYDQCDSTCHGGCYHGTIEQYLKERNIPLTDENNQIIAKEINRICGKKEDYSIPLVYS